MQARKIRRRETVLITGASSGIGAALAHCFARGRCNLVLVARRARRLQALARELEVAYRVDVRVASVDLQHRRSVPALAESLRRRRVPVDILVNNAGIIELGRFTGMAATRSQQIIAVNVAATTALLSHFVPPMVRRGHGRVLNVCSIASFVPVPALATYAATKAYLLSLSESLSEELDGTGVTVTALCPGITDTPMKVAIVHAHPRVAKLPGILVADAGSVASQGYEACMGGEAVCVPGVVNWAAAVSGRTLPRWLVRRVAGVVGRRTG